MKTIRLGKVSVDPDGYAYFPARYDDNIFLLPLHNAGYAFDYRCRAYLTRWRKMRDMRRETDSERVEIATTIAHVPRYSNPYNEGFIVGELKLVPAMIGTKYLFIPINLLKTMDLTEILTDGVLYDSIGDFLKTFPEAQPIRWEV